MKREPALLYVGLLAPVVQVLAAFVFDANPTVQGAVNAAAVAVAGAVTAVLVRSDSLVPAILGAAQAVLALVLAFGVQWSSEQQASLMGLIGVVVAIVVRDRVEAPVPATVSTSPVQLDGP